MSAVAWVLLVIGIVLLAALVWLTALQLRRGGTPPGPPVGMPPLGTHDEPIEDSAVPIDEKRHQRSAHSVAEDGSDASHMSGGV
jgi:hypothetical protein